MASYLRPRRGKKATAESQQIVLKRGEVFFECPDAGVGTGKGKIKVGDGATKYASLPYFMESFNINASDATIAFTDCSTATDYSNNATYLSNIKPANSIVTLFTNLKQLLFNYNSQLTQLNNDYTTLNSKIGSTAIPSSLGTTITGAISKITEPHKWAISQSSDNAIVIPTTRRAKVILWITYFESTKTSTVYAFDTTNKSGCYMGLNSNTYGSNYYSALTVTDTSFSKTPGSSALTNHVILWWD